MGGMLSELIDLAREPSSEKRRELLGRLSDVFLDGSAEYRDRELLLFSDVLIKLLDQVDVDTRVGVAERVADSSRATTALHMRLAEDEIRVAEPVLTRSEKLDDAALVKLASHHGQGHMMAISRRAYLSPIVTDVLVEQGANDVLASLTRNLGAELSRQGFGKLADRARDDDDLQTALSFRGDMPEEVGQRLMNILPEVARARLAELMAFDSEIVRSVIETADERSRQERLARRKRRFETRAMVADAQAGKLTVDEVLIRLSEADRTLDLAFALAELSGLDETVTNHSLLKIDPEPISLLLRSIGAAKSTVELIGRLRSRRLSLPNSMIARMVESWDRVDTETAQRVVRFTKVRTAL